MRSNLHITIPVSYTHLDVYKRQMHWRIANEVARIEAKYQNGLNAQQLYELLDHFKYLSLIHI